MKDNAEEISNYPDQLKVFRHFNNEAEFIEKEINQYVQKVGPLEDARICLSVGTGYGEFDIMFIRNCLPNLEKLIVVEKDGNCIKELKINLRNEFGGKFKVEIYETTIEEFSRQRFLEENGKEFVRKVDVVLSFHALYLTTHEDRMTFFDSCSNICLKRDSGVIVILSGNETCEFAILYEKILDVKYPCVYKLEREVESFGFELTHGVEHQLSFDFSDPHKAYDCMFLINCHVTKEIFNDILNDISADGKVHQTCKFCVFERGLN